MKNMRITDLIGLLFLLAPLNALDVEESRLKGSLSHNLMGYAESELAIARGNTQKALSKLEKNAPHDKNMQYAQQHARIRALMKSGDYAAIAKIKNVYKDDLEIQLIFLQAYANTNELKKAQALLDELHKSNESNEQVIYITTMFYTQTKQPERALSYLEGALKNKSLGSKDALFLFLKSKIYISLGKYKEALGAINSSLEINPQFDKGLLLKAALLSQLNDPQGAIDTYKKYVELGEDSSEAIKQLVQLLFSQKKFDEALSYLKKIKEDSAEYYFDYALIALSGKKLEEASEYVNKSLAKNPQFKKAYLLKLSILLSNKQTKEVLLEIENALKKNPTDLFILKTLPEILKSGISEADMAQMLERVVAHSSSTRINGALVDLYLATKEFDKAIKHCNIILENTNDELLKSKAYFQLAYLNFSKSNHEPVEKFLHAALKTKKVYTPAYNFLAFYYASTSNKLDKALHYIDKALKEEPTNAHYQETKKYIELKTKKNS
jgi:tetratricopeptide (TPR) repeat protein